MTGLTNFSADNLLSAVLGTTPYQPLATTGAVWLGLFTAVGTDANTGFTEVSGGSYARVQVAGALPLSASFTTASTTLTLGSTAPAWLLALGTNGSGVNVWDATNAVANGPIGTVSSITGTTVTLTSTATHASTGTTDSLYFSAFPVAAGTAPATVTNGAAITFPAATATWGTVISFGLFDAVTSGNLLLWDFLGNFAWLPFENPTGSNLLTVKGNGYASNDPIVFTAEYGGTLPTMSTGTFTSYTVNFVATPATDAINVDTTTGPATPIVLTSSGSGMVRKIVQQSIPSGVTASFAASALTATAA